MNKTLETSGLKTKNQALVIERDFDAPRELLWRAWTESDLAKLWWGPANYTSPFAQFDLRVGGKFLFCMRSPEGLDIWSTGEYLEIDYPNLLVCTDHFADEHGNVVPGSIYGMSEDFPLELLVKTTFEQLPGGRTRFTLRHENMPPDELVPSRGGWGESFDKLDRLLATLK